MLAKGRPKTRFYTPKSLQTRITDNIKRLLKQITAQSYRNDTEMFQEMLSQFLAEKPYLHGLKWRTPKSIRSKVAGEAVETGWKLLAIQARPEQAQEINDSCIHHSISVATYLYTCIYWWIEYKN